MLGNEIVFAEVDTQGNVKTCTGLAYFYLLTQESIPPIWIMDNHHHAFYARVHAYNQTSTPLTIVHIDAHADLSATSVLFDSTHKKDETYLWHYTNEVCTIASFIQPLIDVHIVQECLQVRTAQKLSDICMSPPTISYILDIDLDFFALTTDSTELQIQLTHIRLLLANAYACTIATSPYFLGQQRAYELLIAIMRK